MIGLALNARVFNFLISCETRILLGSTVNRITQIVFLLILRIFLDNYFTSVTLAFNGRVIDE
jgi:hypothetical protein